MSNDTLIKHCEDCEVTFQVYARRRRGKFYCPLCGESSKVKDHKAFRNGIDIKGKGTKPRWTEEELLLLRQVLKGKKSGYTVARLIGRSTNAVSKKVGRMRKEQQKERAEINF